MNEKLPKEQLNDADVISDGPYLRMLSQDEKSGLAESISAVSEIINDREDEKADIVKVMGAEIKEKKKYRRDLLKQKRTGYMDASGKLYTFYKLEERSKYVYDAEGDLVQSGRMTAEEFTEAQQLSMHGVLRIDPAANA